MWFIMACVIGGLGCVGWLAYKVSPELSLALLVATIVYTVIGDMPSGTTPLDPSKLPRFGPDGTRRD